MARRAASPGKLACKAPPAFEGIHLGPETPELTGAVIPRCLGGTQNGQDMHADWQLERSTQQLGGKTRVLLELPRSVNVIRSSDEA
jgi:hypothetical protein